MEFPPEPRLLQKHVGFLCRGWAEGKQDDRPAAKPAAASAKRFPAESEDPPEPDLLFWEVRLIPDERPVWPGELAQAPLAVRRL